MLTMLTKGENWGKLSEVQSPASSAQAHISSEEKSEGRSHGHVTSLEGTLL